MGKTKRPVSQQVLERIGANVKRLRADTTQVALAAASGLGQSTLSRIEAGNYPPLDVDTLVRLSLALKCGLGDLFDGTDQSMIIIRYEQDLAA